LLIEVASPHQIKPFDFNVACAVRTAHATLIPRSHALRGNEGLREDINLRTDTNDLHVAQTVKTITSLSC